MEVRSFCPGVSKLTPVHPFHRDRGEPYRKRRTAIDEAADAAVDSAATNVVAEIAVHAVAAANNEAATTRFLGSQLIPWRASTVEALQRWRKRRKRRRSRRRRRKRRKRGIGKKDRCWYQKRWDTR